MCQKFFFKIKPRVTQVNCFFVTSEEVSNRKGRNVTSNFLINTVRVLVLRRGQTLLLLDCWRCRCLVLGAMCQTATGRIRTGEGMEIFAYYALVFRVWGALMQLSTRACVMRHCAAMRALDQLSLLSGPGRGTDSRRNQQIQLNKFTPIPLLLYVITRGFSSLCVCAFVLFLPPSLQNA